MYFTVKSTDFCLACEAEARHMYCFSGVVVVVVVVGGVVGGVNFFVLGHFLGNYKGWSHETWVMHTSWRVKLNPMFSFETWPTFHGSLTNVEFLRLGHFLGNYKG